MAERVRQLRAEAAEFRLGGLVGELFDLRAPDRPRRPGGPGNCPSRYACHAG